MIRANQAPIAADDTYATAVNTALTVPAPGVLANDTDTGADATTAGSASDPANGAVTLNPDGSLTYTPDAGFSGTDTFTYVVSDPHSASDTGLVSVVVNDPPVAGDDAYAAAANTPLTVVAPGVLGNDTDIAGPLTASSASDPAKGDVTLNTDGSFTYTPDVDFTGTDTFTYVVTDPHGATDAGAVTIATSGPALSVGAVSVPEGDAGTRNAVFTVSMSEPSASTVTVAYGTADGTAVAPGDYTAKSGTLSFAPGSTSAVVKVAVPGDTLDEADKSFTLALSGAVGATIANGSGLGTVADDDPKGVTGRQLGIGDVTVHEGDAGTRTAHFTVSLSKASTSYVKVNFATANGTATKAGDYTRTTGTVTFAPGTTSNTVKVIVNPDDIIESDETFTVNLTGATGATVTDAIGLGTIVNDDA